MEAVKRNYDDLDITVLDTTCLTREEIYKAVDSAHLAVTQSPGSKEGLGIIQDHKLDTSLGKKGVPVSTDYDDFSFDLSPYNPRYKDLGTAEVQAKDKD